ncbi:MAG: hypothetical protein C5B49_08465, partial [Bdellovibrio sp.]
MKTIFVETSALLRILLQEPGFEKAVEKLETADRLFASRLLKLEAERAVIRAAHMQGERQPAVLISLRFNLKQLWSRFDCLEISREICDLAGQIAPESNLRSLDAIHAATFQWLTGLSQLNHADFRYVPLPLRVLPVR